MKSSISHLSKKLTPIFTFPMLLQSSETITSSNVVHADEQKTNELVKIENTKETKEIKVDNKQDEKLKVEKLKQEKLRVNERLKQAESKEEEISLKTQKLNIELSLKPSKIKTEEPKVVKEVKTKKEEKPKTKVTTTQQVNVETYAPQAGSVGQTPISQATNPGNTYGHGWCTWGVKQVAPWVGNYWGDAYQWAASAASQGFKTGTTPVPGSVIVWSGNHVAYVTDVREDGMIQVLEANYAGQRYVANFRGWFNPNGIQGNVTYIYPKS